MLSLEEYHEEKIRKFAGIRMHKYGNTMHMTDVFEGAHVPKAWLYIIVIAASF